MNPIYEINQLLDKLPIEVVQDLHQRIADWLAMGGEHDDPYMVRQLEYAQEIARGYKRESETVTFKKG